MKYIKIKNIDKYNPGYTDRNLIWGKIHFTMVHGDIDCEMLCEIDFARFVKLILLQLQTKNLIPIESGYLSRKGFDLTVRPIEKTIESLKKFVEIIEDKEEKIPENKVKVTVTTKKLTPNSDVTFLREEFYRKFEELRGEKYKKSYSYDGHVFQKLLVDFSREIILEKMDVFFASDDVFIKDKMGHTIKAFDFKFNSLQVKKDDFIRKLC